MIYVAIVGKKENLGIGVEHPRAFTSKNKEGLIRKALAVRNEMESNGNGPYKIFIGEMNQSVEVPNVYRLVKIK